MYFLTAKAQTLGPWINYDRKAHMKYLPLCLILSFLFTSCAAPAYMNPGDISFSPIQDSSGFRKDSSSVMVVGLQNSNSIVLMVEQVLLQQQVQLIADPEIQLQTPVMSTRRVTADTIINSTVLEPVVRKLHSAKSADYVLRYRYTGDTRTLSAFHASLINQRSGAIVSSFSYSSRTKMYPRTQVVLERFARDMFLPEYRRFR
ncbi:hypothetical protein CEQ90_10655 [Lewinellaceae bacterium SD302]|nr:hypothetical protein CEQ90_10655 [Lewinellaceae bacterium SD302]